MSVSTVPKEGRAILTQAMMDGREAAKFTIRCGLDTTDSLGRDIASSVALRRHAWLRSTGFSGDVQASLMDMPFDGSCLFGDEADSVLGRLRRVGQQHSLWAYRSPRQIHSSFRPFCGYGRGYQPRTQFQPYPQGQQASQSFRGRGRGSHRGRGSQS